MVEASESISVRGLHILGAAILKITGSIGAVNLDMHIIVGCFSGVRGRVVLHCHILDVFGKKWSDLIRVIVRIVA